MTAGLARPAAPEDPARALLDRIAVRTARVAVVGVGYVGLPLALSFARPGGLRALGVDVDAARSGAVAAGRSPVRHVSSERVAEAVSAGRLAATADPSRAAECDAVLVCVPTPLGRGREPDLSYVTRAVTALAPAVRPGHLVVLESTTWPGTTDEIVRPILEAGSGLVAGRDFFLASTRSSTRPRPSRSASCRSGPGRASAATASPRRRRDAARQGPPC